MAEHWRTRGSTSSRDEGARHDVGRSTMTRSGNVWIKIPKIICLRHLISSDCFLSSVRMAAAFPLLHALSAVAGFLTHGPCHFILIYTGRLSSLHAYESHDNCGSRTFPILPSFDRNTLLPFFPLRLFHTFLQVGIGEVTSTEVVVAGRGPVKPRGLRSSLLSTISQIISCQSPLHHR